jgi:hypothetical protein
MDSSRNTPTAAGQTVSDNTAAADARHAMAAAIDQMFAEFELVYHNQFQKAFPTAEKLTYARRLWFSHLKDYKPEQILAAVRRVTQESEYLPTVQGVMKYLGASALGLPESRDAYREACLAPSPKAEQRWSHPAVYLAGAASDWFFLANQPEKMAFPVYEKHYRLLCERVAQGETLQMPAVAALPETIHQPLTAEQRHEAMQALRASVGL